MSARFDVILLLGLTGAFAALDGKKQVAPGDTIWLRGGTYKHPFEVVGHGWSAQAGVCDGKALAVSVTGEFAAFVVIRESAV